MKNTLYILAIFLFAFSCSTQEVACNKVCPISGDDVDAKITTVKYEGKVYGFCCSDCDKMFSANPTKYASNISSDGSTFVETSK